MLTQRKGTNIDQKMVKPDLIILITWQSVD